MKSEGLAPGSYNDSMRGSNVNNKLNIFSIALSKISENQMS